MTDPEARKMKMGDGGFRPAYNVQFATATGSLVIVGPDGDGGGSGDLSPAGGDRGVSERDLPQPGIATIQCSRIGENQGGHLVAGVGSQFSKDPRFETKSRIGSGLSSNKDRPRAPSPQPIPQAQAQAWKNQRSGGATSRKFTAQVAKRTRSSSNKEPGRKNSQPVCGPSTTTCGPHSRPYRSGAVVYCWSEKKR